MEKRVTTVGLLSRMSSNKNGKWIVCEHPWLLNVNSSRTNPETRKQQTGASDSDRNWLKAQ